MVQMKANSFTSPYSLCCQQAETKLLNSFLRIDLTWCVSESYWKGLLINQNPASFTAGSPVRNLSLSSVNIQSDFPYSVCVFVCFFSTESDGVADVCDHVLFLSDVAVQPVHPPCSGSHHLHPGLCRLLNKDTGMTAWRILTVHLSPLSWVKGFQLLV